MEAKLRQEIGRKACVIVSIANDAWKWETDDGAAEVHLALVQIHVSSSTSNDKETSYISQTNGSFRAFFGRKCS